jgi:oligo-1,6-glucosidase
LNSNSKWWQHAVVYQVYPKSFQDSDGDGLGDLNGITSRLDYIKDLGVDVIWLNPVYKSPQVDNGYDISDYQSINPSLGTMQDFERLLHKAHEMNLKIVMDLVVNHTSDQHKWFVESKKSKDNKYRDYYIWKDPVDGHAPTNWEASFSGPAWTYDDTTKQYYLHLFAPQQPDLNWENEEMRNNVYNMMNWWSDKGVDGFRMDVISLISKPEDFDNKELQESTDSGKYVSNGPHIHDYLREMNKNVMKKHDLMTVGETPGVNVKEALKYANLDDSELNMVFEFEHMGLDSNPNPALGKWSDQKASLVDLKNNLSKWQKGLYGKAWNSLYWNNHDQPRVVSRFGNDSKEYRELSAKMLAMVLHLLQGTPYIYEGEELGMTNIYFDSLDDYRDLESINAYHEFVDEKKLVDGPTMMSYLKAKSRDNARTPMQWSDDDYAGFSDKEPWIKVNPNYKSINAKEEVSDPNSVYNFYKELISLRHSLPVITDGTYEQVEGTEDDDSLYAYVRKDDNQTLMVVANYTDKEIDRPVLKISKDDKLLLSNYDDDLANKLRPYEAKLYVLD